MAKAESGLRDRIKAALEADGWSVLTVHGSAYNPHIPDLMVVLAGLEVKTERGKLRPGQRNKIRRLRQQGIPAGVVRSIEDARQGMQIVKQGRYQMALDIDTSFLDSLLADDTDTVEVPDSPAEPTLNELMGMPGQYEEFTPQPAADETPELQPAPAEQTYNFVDGNGRDVKPSDLEMNKPAPQQPIERGSWTTPVPFPSGFGTIEQIAASLMRIEQMLSGLIDGFTEVASGPSGESPSEAVQPKRRGRRPKAQTEE